MTFLIVNHFIGILLDNREIVKAGQQILLVWYKLYNYTKTTSENKLWIYIT